MKTRGNKLGPGGQNSKPMYLSHRHCSDFECISESNLKLQLLLTLLSRREEGGERRGGGGVKWAFTLAGASECSCHYLHTISQSINQSISQMISVNQSLHVYKLKFQRTKNIQRTIFNNYFTNAHWIRAFKERARCGALSQLS